MRKIKFRVWDKLEKKMLDNANVRPIALGYLEDETCTGGVYADNLYEFMQYTGLKDKNGKEIWENDIVCFQFDNDNCTLPYTDTKKRYGKIFFSDYRASFAIAMGRNGSKSMNNDLYKYVQCGNRVEVIGNIFDNPELLDADKQASKYADNDVMKPAT